MTNNKWSRLIDTEMGEFVLDYMDSNSALKYHNSEHIRRLYAWAQEWGLEYDPVLDAAILWHDSIYDDQPDKEIRSAVFMAQKMIENPHWLTDTGLPGYNIGEVQDLIRTTIDHRVSNIHSSLLIKLDLADLTLSDVSRDNFWKLIQEGQKLYGVTAPQAAQNTITFLSNFLTTINANCLDQTFHNEFPGDGEMFWNDVENNVKQSISMAKTIIEYHERGFV